MRVWCRMKENLVPSLTYEKTRINANHSYIQLSDPYPYPYPMNLTSMSSKHLSANINFWPCGEELLPQFCISEFSIKFPIRKLLQRCWDKKYKCTSKLDFVNFNGILIFLENEYISWTKLMHLKLSLISWCILQYKDFRHQAVFARVTWWRHQMKTFFALLAICAGIWPVNSPHKWPVTRKMFPFDDVIM